MTSTVFIDQQTLIQASWLNDVNTAVYTTSLGTAPTALVSINGGQLGGLRNRIINGDMRIDQRNSGAAVTPAAATYLVDRFICYGSPASKFTYQQVVDAPAGFKYSMKITVASQYSPAAADYFHFRQPIEGQNIIDFQLGQAGAATITLSNYIKGSVAGVYAVSVFNSTGARSYVGTINVTTSWARVAITLVGDVSGTWLTDNGVGMYWCLDLGSGTNYNATAGSWQASFATRTLGSVTFVNQTAGSTLNITGVQVELGSVPTVFEQRQIGPELELCQRYYRTGYARQQGYAISGSGIKILIQYKNMRAAPTVLLSGRTDSGNITSSAAGEIEAYQWAYSVVLNSTNTFFTNEVYTASAEL